MQDQEPSHSFTETVSFRDELERHVRNSGMSYRQIAGNSWMQLYRALRGQPVDRDNLIQWCNALYQRGTITKYEANRLMNLAGHATPAQYKRAMTNTTSHRAIVVKRPR